MALALGIAPGAVEVRDHCGPFTPFLFSGPQGTRNTLEQLLRGATSVIPRTNSTCLGARTTVATKSIFSAEFIQLFLEGQNLTPVSVPQGLAFEAGRGAPRSILATMSSKRVLSDLILNSVTVSGYLWEYDTAVHWIHKPLWTNNDNNVSIL